MDKRRLRYFLMACEELNLVRAAERLHIAQSALSRHIKALESEVGFCLFDRVPSGVRLTNAGLIYREEARYLLRAFEDAQLRAKKAFEGEIGQLDIGVNEVSIYEEQVLSILDEFRKLWPNVSLNIHIAHSQEQVELLARKKISLGFVYNTAINDDAIVSERIASTDLRVILNRSHPLAAKPAIEKADLADQRFVIYKKRDNFVYYWDLIFENLLAKGVRPLVVQEVSSVWAMVSLVAAGVGLSFVHSSYWGAEHPRLMLRPVSDLPMPLELSAIWRSDDRSETLARFIDCVNKRPSVPVR